MPAGSPRWSRAGQDRATPRSHASATYARSFHARLSRWSRRSESGLDAAAILVAASGIAGYVAVTVVRCPWCCRVPWCCRLRRSSCCDRNTYCDVAREALLSTGGDSRAAISTGRATRWGSTRVIARWSGDGPQCTQSAAGRSGPARDPATVARSRSLQGDDPPPGGPAVACPPAERLPDGHGSTNATPTLDRCLAARRPSIGARRQHRRTVARARLGDRRDNRPCRRPPTPEAAAHRLRGDSAVHALR